MANSLPLGVDSSAGSRHFLASMPAMLAWRSFCIVLAKLWLSLICLIISSVASAESIPSSMSDVATPPTIYYRATQYAFAGNYSSLGAAQAAWSQGYTQYWGVSCSHVWNQETATSWRVTVKSPCSGTVIGVVLNPICAPETGTFNSADNMCHKNAYSCPAAGDWTLSADQQTCTRPDCPAGYERDPNTGACLEPCPANHVRNLSTMQCEVVCESPLVRTAANTCDCTDPLTLIDGNTCIGSDDKDRGENCGQEKPEWWQ